MTIYERVKKAFKECDFEKDDINKLVWFAYYIGKEEATVNVSDEYKKILQSQHKRAAQCRYYKMAEKIIGYPGNYIYFPDYSKDVTVELATDKWEGE